MAIPRGVPADELRERIAGHDMVNHPPHYTDTGAKCKCGAPIEVIQITRELNFCLGNVVKYILRAGKKGDAIEDLKKAAKYIEFEIERLTVE